VTDAVVRVTSLRGAPLDPASASRRTPDETWSDHCAVGWNQSLPEKGIEGSEIEVRAVLVWLSSVERRALELLPKRGRALDDPYVEGTPPIRAGIYSRAPGSNDVPYRGVHCVPGGTAAAREVRAKGPK